MIYTQNDSQTKLTENIEILNLHLDIDRKRDITVLNTTELSDNEKNDKHTRNTGYYKCKQHGHTKKQCHRYNKIVKQISELEFEKDVCERPPKFGASFFGASDMESPLNFLYKKKKN